MGFFSFFRTANLVPCSLDSFSPHQVLSRGSITFTSSGTLITVMHENSSGRGHCSRRPSTLHHWIPFAPQQPSNLYLWPFQPDSYPLFTFLHLWASSTVSQQCPSTMLLNIWPPCCLSIPLISLVIVCIGEVLLSPSSAEYRLSSSNSKVIGDLTHTCFI